MNYKLIYSLDQYVNNWTMNSNRQYYYHISTPFIRELSRNSYALLPMYFNNYK